jgi:UDP-GlcNAc:undecaprenyl-phosphate/decaprenyl-phosphate GlcNAc-1-phosphate transferase
MKFEEGLIIFLSTLAITIFVTSICLYLLKNIGWIDNPKKYGQNRKPVPYPIGIIVAPLMSIFLLWYFGPTKEVLGIILSSMLLMTIAFVDDKKSLSPFLRLIAQIVAIGILILFGLGVDSFTHPFEGYTINANEIWKIETYIFGQYISFSPLADILTFVWVLLFINVMNWLDGIPGNVTGMTAIGAGILFFVSLMPTVNQTETATFALLLMSISLGILIFHFPYPQTRSLLGDSGSMIFGFFLAILAIFYGGKIATTVLLFALPLLDAFAVIIRRILNKKNPFHGDYTHFHHRLLRAGWSRAEVCIFFYSTSACFGISSLYLDSSTKIFVFASVTSIFLLYLIFLEKYLPEKFAGPF